MRSSNKKRSRAAGRSLAPALLALILVSAGTTVSQAQFRGGNTTMGPRSMGGGAAMYRGGFQGAGPRPGRFQNSMSSDTVVIGGRRRGDDVSVVRPPRRDDPRRPGRRPRPHGPVIGPSIGTGVVISVPVATPRPAGAGPSGVRPAATTLAQRSGVHLPPADEQRYVKDEVLLEFSGTVTRRQSGVLAARHRLTRIESLYFPQTRTTLFRWKINDSRSVRTVLTQLGRERVLTNVQPNYIYSAAQGIDTAPVAESSKGGTFMTPADAAPKPTPVVATTGAKPAAGDPAQYALAKLRIGEAHSLANGDKVLVAVIDSGIDLDHPELKDAVAGSYDALGGAWRPHAHGTAIAGAIAARAKLMGAAPAARILAIRAFSAGSSAESTTMAIVKSVKYATDQKARVINMSFAGPADPALRRHLAAAKANGAVLVAAAGNFGPKSPPQFPAADANVIAVSATDANDRMFKASNVGSHVAVASPGVDILLPAPDNDYQLTSGTSFSAAYVSGVAALVLQRAPGLTADGVRKILESTARDLGPSGKDPEYGAGLVDAYQAILAVEANAQAQPAEGVRSGASTR